MPEVYAWRATFRFPHLRGDQLAVSVPAPVPVEVYRKSRHKWDAREPRSKNSYNLDGVSSDVAAKAHIEQMFRECVETWVPYDAFGNQISGEVNANA
jgi:hypothetical protein